MIPAARPLRLSEPAIVPVGPVSPDDRTDRLAVIEFEPLPSGDFELAGTDVRWGVSVFDGEIYPDPPLRFSVCVQPLGPGTITAIFDSDTNDRPYRR